MKIFAKIIDWFFWQWMKRLIMKNDVDIIGNCIYDKRTGLSVHILDKKVATPEVLSRIKLMIYNYEQIKDAQRSILKHK